MSLGSNSYEELVKVFKDEDNIGDIPVIARFKLPILFGSERITRVQYVSLLKLALENINSQIPLQRKDVTYSDEESKSKSEISELVARLLDLLPPDDRWPVGSMIVVLIDDPNLDLGLEVVYTMGVLTHTGQEDVFYVSDRTVLALEVFGVSHEILQSIKVIDQRL